MERRKSLIKLPRFRGTKKEEFLRQTNLALETITIDELYEEVLYEMLHVVGCDSEYQNDALFSYLKEAFKMDDEKHNEAMKVAREKEAPSILLNVEVIQAKDLHPKDANGLSDPFVTLFLSKNASHRYNTSVKSETLSPTWEEYFSLPAENSLDDNLAIEVWDFDPAETVKEKLTKIGGVKGVRGLRKLMKEIAVTASTGKHDNEIIGFVNIPLRSIPSSGHVKWYHLEKKTSRAKGSRGAIQLKLAFSSEKNNQVAAQEHRHLMRILVLQEMESSKHDLQKWDGNLRGPASIVLKQHAAQSGLRLADEKLAQWVEFTRLHANQPLNFKVIADTITSIIEPLNNGLYSDDEIRMFWDGAKRLLPSIFISIRKYRKSSQTEKLITTQVGHIIRTISELVKLKQPENLELFSKPTYDWLPERSSSDILTNLKKAITKSAEEWFQEISSMKNNKKNYEDTLQHVIQVVHLTKTDLQKSIEIFDKPFYDELKFQHSLELFQIYDKKISTIIEPLVTEICVALKPLCFKVDEFELKKAEIDTLAVGTSLFELYIALQRCLTLGQGLMPVDDPFFKLNSFHTWFHKGVAQWLDIAVYKAMQRIEKAVNLDKLIPVDSLTKHSSSATDTMFIFYQIKIFWIQLAWPDVEGSYTFVAKIIDDICRLSVFYVDKMSEKIEKIGETDSAFGKQFIVTNESGEIRSTSCECVRGQVKCHHMAALLLYANKNISQTDAICRWVKPSGNAAEASTSAAVFPPQAFHALDRNVTNADKEFLFKGLRSLNRFSGFHWLLQPETENVATEHDKTFAKVVESSTTVEEIRQNFRANEGEIARVSLSTVGQRDNPLWHAMRLGRITASNFGAVLSAVGRNRFPPSLFKRLLGSYNLDGVMAVQWGTSNEDYAIQEFTKITGLEVKKCGLFLHVSGVLGASPDGLVGGNSTIEVKCPFRLKNCNRDEVINDKDYCLKQEDELQLKEDHPFYDQVQGQLYLANKESAFFVIYTTKDTVIVNVKKNPAWEANLKILINFYFDHYINKLLE